MSASLKLITAFSLLLFTQCISKKRGIIYDPEHKLALDVYSPKKVNAKKDVLVFVHGGNWRSGKRSTYKFFGKGFARKGLVSVVIDYRLTDQTDYLGMTTDVGKAVKWVYKNISSFGGDSSQIFISGHSSGGHNAALLATVPDYFETLHIENPIKGVILIDAFGLDMYTYLSNSVNKEDSIYYQTFTNDPSKWKDGSPIYYLKKSSPKFLLFVGGKTYPAIKENTDAFMTALKPFQPEAKLIKVNRKKHIPMIAQFYNPWNKRYKEILSFMKETR